jgi:hypothetical protein
MSTLGRYLNPEPEIAARYRERGWRLHTGAANELIVAADLMRKGFEVFRNLSPRGLVDVIARRGPDLFRIQVKSASCARSPASPEEKEANDLFAFVTDGSVRYRTLKRRTAIRLGSPTPRPTSRGHWRNWMDVVVGERK